MLSMREAAFVASVLVALGLLLTAFVRLRRGRRIALARAGLEPAAPPEPPAHVRGTLADAEKLGLAIWRFDSAAARASDALVEKVGSPDSRVLGWIFADSDTLEVLFVGELGSELKIFYRVRIGDGCTAPDVEILDPPVALTPSERSQAAALRKAQQTPFPRVARAYNFVVLPAELVDQSGWLVYMLAATTNPDEMLVGGHCRIKVSPTMDNVEVFPFALTDLRAVAGENVREVTVTHLVSETPLEHHVYLNLLHRIPLRVLTKLGAWGIENGRIGYGGPFPDDERSN